jgi:hypothetical protein
LSTLEEPIDEAEIDGIIRALPNDKSLGPDGFNNKFLKKCWCNTLGVYHQLSSGFKLKHDRLSGDEDVKVNLWK